MSQDTRVFGASVLVGWKGKPEARGRGLKNTRLAMTWWFSKVLGIIWNMNAALSRWIAEPIPAWFRNRSRNGSFGRCVVPVSRQNTEKTDAGNL